MAKLKTQFNDLVEAPQNVFFENTITLTKDLNNNQVIDISQYDNYKIIIDGQDTTFGGTLEFVIPSKFYIEFINISTIDGGNLDFGQQLLISLNQYIDGVAGYYSNIGNTSLPTTESTNVYLYVEKIGKIINVFVLGN